MKKTISVVTITFLPYLIACIFQPDFWGDILSPVCGLLAAGIIFYSIYLSGNTQFRPNLLLAGASVLSWVSADILWAIYDFFLHKDPGSSELISAFYFGTNLFLFIAMIFYCIYRFQKWDTIQLILDSVFISIAVLWLLWLLVFDKKYSALGFLAQDSVINTLSIITDIIELVVITIWYLSIRKGKISLSFRIISGAVLIYSIIDLVYFYSCWKNIYIPNSLLDACYMATLLGLAVGIKCFYVQFPSRYDVKYDSNSNIGNLYKGLLLIPAPVLVLIFKGADWFDIFFFIVLILLHELFSSYIQTAVSNKRLLARELNLNQELELRISERTEDLKQKNDELKYISDHDQLTGLYNRSFFLQRLEDKIKEIVCKNQVVLLLWNVDRLKGINGIYGHAVGDQILIVLAQRVKNITLETDVMARFGGDEFALASAGNFQKEEVKNVAKKITDVCSEPIQIGQYTFHITVSVGVSMFPLCAPDSNTLLKNADVAMRHAKDTGFGNRIFFYEDIDAAMQRKHLIGSFLKKADYSKEFSLHYQPQFRIADQKLVGMEALLRWNCPELGTVSPSEFIPIAEEENLIIPIGNWVIEQAVSQISAWNHAYHTDLKVGINISPKQLDQTDVLEIMSSSIQRNNAAIDWIDIEITEGIALDNEDKAARIRQYFQNQGISISIDDFGTGYSSLGYLNMLSFDRLKIAKPLIDKIASDKTSMKIVSSIIMLAKSLGILTLSEGVESKEQFNLLLDFGCDQIQGFYLGKPMPPEKFQDVFMTRNTIKVET